MFRKKKMAFAKAQLVNLEANNSSGRAREFYRKSKLIASGFKPGSQNIRNTHGDLVTDTVGILDEWRRHFMTLLNNNIQPNIATSHTTSSNNDSIQTPTYEEVETAIKRLKNNKAAGADGIAAELFKAGGDSLIRCMHDIITQIWIEEDMPKDWNVSVIRPIHKKGDRMMCANYRDISLINIGYKILSTILCDRLKPYSEKLIGNYQCGFRPGKSTTDQMFTLRQILQKTNEFNIDTHHLFIDFKAAYDTICREELFVAMSEFQIPQKLIQLCRMTLSETLSAVSVGQKSSDLFETCTGFRQGDALSCAFFNIVLESIVRRAGVDTRQTIYTKSTQLLGYADDIDIIGRTERAVIETFVKIKEKAMSVGLAVNESKTKYMMSTKNESRRHQLGQTVNADICNFEVVEEFIYLGANINSANDICVEIRRRIVLANRCFYGLKKQLASKFLSWGTKILQYKTLILPVLIYGSETWTLTRESENALGVFERKILRQIFGAVNIDGEWRRRYNSELYQLYRDVDIVKKLKVRRLQWFGHVQRMPDDATAKRVYASNPHGVRTRGAQALRWRDNVECDADNLLTGTWRSNVRDRNKWRNCLNSII